MHIIKKLLKEANNAYNKADYLAYMTYPLVKEAKLLGVIIDNINIALTKGVEAVVAYDRLYKRVALIKSSFSKELAIFRDHCSRRHNIDPSIISLIKEISAIAKSRKESPVEFVRNNKYIICSNDYKMKTITMDKVKNYLEATKQFMMKINQIIR